MVGDLRLAADVHWYARGLVSQERAAGRDSILLGS
jgi:hypothetical protein